MTFSGSDPGHSIRAAPAGSFVLAPIRPVAPLASGVHVSSHLGLAQDPSVGALTSALPVSRNSSTLDSAARRPQQCRFRTRGARPSSPTISLVVVQRVHGVDHHDLLARAAPRWSPANTLAAAPPRTRARRSSRGRVSRWTSCSSIGGRARRPTRVFSSSAKGAVGVSSNPASTASSFGDEAGVVDRARARVTPCFHSARSRSRAPAATSTAASRNEVFCGAGCRILATIQKPQASHLVLLTSTRVLVAGVLYRKTMAERDRIAGAGDGRAVG